MIDGTPARFEMLISITSVTQDLRAYSSRYTPAAMPRGTAVAAVTTITTIVPTQAERMPDLLANREG